MKKMGIFLLGIAIPFFAVSSSGTDLKAFKTKKFVSLGLPIVTQDDLAAMSPQDRTNQLATHMTLASWLSRVTGSPTSLSNSGSTGSSLGDMSDDERVQAEVERLHRGYQLMHSPDYDDVVCKSRKHTRSLERLFAHASSQQQGIYDQAEQQLLKEQRDFDTFTRFKSQLLGYYTDCVVKKDKQI